MAKDQSPSRKQPVMFDVAQRAGVSQKTVSRVVNGDDYVSDAVRARVNDAIRELGFRRNSAARALVTQRTSCIGVVTLGGSHFGLSAVLTSIERAARDAGYFTVVASTADRDEDEVARAVDFLVDRGAEGVIISEPLDGTVLRRPHWRNLPIVALASSEQAGGPTAAAIGPDQYGGAHVATQHLIDLGHISIAHVAGPERWVASRVRRAGWEAALTDAGLSTANVFSGDWSPESGYAAGLRAIDARCTAVFAANDHMAVGLMRAALERGIRVPEDLSIVGFDDVPEAGFLAVALTTIRQDLAKVAQVGVERVIRAIEEGGDVGDASETLIPVELVVRESTAVAAQ